MGNCDLLIDDSLPLPPKYPDELKDIGDHILKRRYDLKISQAQLAKIIGVSTDTITYWENKRTEPMVQFYGKIIEFLGYNPFEFEIKTWGDKLKHYRFRNGLTQKALGQLTGIDPSTIATWENYKSGPRGKKVKRFEAFLNQDLKES